jgi:hypothetical protein
MVLADDATNGGANRAAIGQAFSAHGVQLGSSSLLLPKAGLAGKPPRAGKAAAKVSPATLKDIRRRLGVSSGARLSVAPIALGSERAVAVVHQRAVSLTGIAKELKGVVAMAPEAVIVGRSGASAAAFSAIPDQATTVDEVTKFVETLVAHGLIDFGREKPAKPKASLALGAGRRRALATPRLPKLASLPTHRIVTQGGREVLVRIRFIC